jgi:hypothetical protein
VSSLCWNWSREQVSKPVSDSLQVRECTEEVRTSRRGPISSTELRDFRPGLLLKAKEREV